VSILGTCSFIGQGTSNRKQQMDLFGSLLVDVTREWNQGLPTGTQLYPMCHHASI